MRILLATMAMDIGGAETHILELAKELKRRKHEVYVVSNGGSYVKELEAAGIEHIWAPLHNKKITNMQKAYRILQRTIQEKQIDLVHSHTRISSFLCGRLHKKMGFPFVTTAHWTFKVTPLLKWMTDWGETVIAVSEDIKAYLLRNYPVKEEQIFVTVNGIDTDKFQKGVDTSAIEKEFSLSKEATRIVSISRLDDSRALVARQLVNIAESLSKTIEHLEIVLVGGGDAFEEIQAEANRVNEAIGRKVVFLTGARTDINQWAACGTIFVGVSRSALEAMACEQPAIIAGNEGYLGIFDANQLAKGIETNFCCRGLPMVTEKDLERDILALLAEPKAKKEEMGVYNRDVVQQYYSVAKMTDDCEKAYQATLQKRKEKSQESQQK